MSINNQIQTTATQRQARLDEGVMQGSFIQPLGRIGRSVSNNAEADNDEVHEMLSKAGMTLDQALKSTPWGRRKVVVVR
jgi:uncharacterized glyoxalase superfamily protein PhnB